MFCVFNQYTILISIPNGTINTSGPEANVAKPFKFQFQTVQLTLGKKFNIVNAQTFQFQTVQLTQKRK